MSGAAPEHAAAAPTAAQAAENQKSEFARLLDRSMTVGEKGIEIKNLEDLGRFARYVVESGLAPKGDTVATVVVKIQAGAELGFTPMRSLTALTAINGRIGIGGDAAKAVIRFRRALKQGTDFEETIVGAGDQQKAVVRAWRAGVDRPTEYEFSVADAKAARLWGKQGPWSEHPKRMLKYRALGFLCRDVFSDVLMGMYITEELRDFPQPTRVERQVHNAPPPVASDPLLDALTPPPPTEAEAAPEDPPDPEPPSPDDDELPFGEMTDADREAADRAARRPSAVASAAASATPATVKAAPGKGLPFLRI